MKRKNRHRVNPLVQSVQNNLNRINFGHYVARVEASLRRRAGRHGTAWILLNHFAPGCPKPTGIY